MKFVMAAYGSRGDVEPCAAVAVELLRRGHDVRMAVAPEMLGFIEAAGLGGIACGPDSRKETIPTSDSAGNVSPKMPNPLSGMLEVAEHFSAVWAERSTTLTALADGADLILTGITEQGLSANVAEYYGIPLAALHFFPPERSRLDGLIGRVTKLAEDAQRRTLGLPETAGPSPPSLAIQAYDELCFPEVAAKWGEQAARRPFVGALTLELPTDADEEALSWIAGGTPPIYFGFGSNVHLAHPAQTVATISAACAQLGERALICSGANDLTGLPHADHVKIVGPVNHSAIFPTCRAAVHHGGAGTTAAGLRAGIPTLVLFSPMLEDQPIWAAVVKQLGVGLGRGFLESSLKTLVADLHHVLAPHYVTRAREVAAQMTKPAESLASAVDLLEGTVRQGSCG
ncbi:MAG: glycosyltransferase [Mycobacterium sp.]|nr:glycosyltransferase [Mycobacterium sp.]